MLPPTIPTSFAPPSASANARRGDIGSSGILHSLSYVILGIALVLAIGVFFYGRILASDESAKSATLAQAEAAINPATVQGFIRLRDRLLSGGKLLTEHVAMSNFFTAFGELVPTTVRFLNLHLSIDRDGIIRVEGSGVAKTFNALASASLIFARDERIKNAIFSNISVNTKDSSVSFSLSAELNPKVVAFSPGAPVAAMPSMTASSTPAVTSTTTTP